MHRFYLPPEECQGGEFQLEEREAHHAADVLRLAPGDAVTVLDGSGAEYSCQVITSARRRVSLAVQKKTLHPPPPCRITLAQALPKGKIIDSIIQKATELGAAAVVPLLTERVATRLEDDEAAAHKAGKWRQVAIEAIKQCGQHWLPQIPPPLTLAEYLAQGGAFDLSLVGSLLGDGRHPREYFSAMPAPATVRIWIGPEGDFTPDELEAIRGSGARPITLGPLVLRTETAAIYTLSVVNYEATAPRPGISSTS